MADAIPVHPKSTEDGAAEAKAKAPKGGVKPTEVQTHIPAAPGNFYKLPDGTIVKDN